MTCGIRSGCRRPPEIRGEQPVIPAGYPDTKTNTIIHMKQHPSLARSIVMAAALSAGTAMAGSTTAPVETGKTAVEPAGQTDWCEKLWSLATLYKNDSNPFIQEIALTGRYQGQYAMVDSDGGNSDGWDHRRFRTGIRMKFLKDFEVKFEEFGDLNKDDFYSGFTEAYVAWKPNDQFNLTVGKQKPKFSTDWSTSSREILTIERNIMINNLGIDYETGVVVNGKSGNWSYYAGAFNNDVGETGEDSEFGDLDGGWSYIASLGYDAKDTFGTEKAIVRADYIHMEHDTQDDLLTRFDNAFAASLTLKQGQWGLVSEFMYAEGDDSIRNGGDFWGFYIMPSYDINKKLQVVARYTYASSSDDALRAQNRYERGTDGIIHTNPFSSDSGYGESYNAGYLGLNYYICGHKLKLMTGLEYATMDGGSDGGDNDSWTWSSGLRLYF
jgi:phosphate-selective porin OprO/OprP